MVVGTNGTGLTAARIGSLMEAGVTGVSISVDSLEARYHNRFRHGDDDLVTRGSVQSLSNSRNQFCTKTM